MLDLVWCCQVSATSTLAATARILFERIDIELKTQYYLFWAVWPAIDEIIVVVTWQILNEYDRGRQLSCVCQQAGRNCTQATQVAS
jgi:hypothetical protein